MLCQAQLEIKHLWPKIQQSVLILFTFQLSIVTNSISILTYCFQKIGFGVSMSLLTPSQTSFLSNQSWHKHVRWSRCPDQGKREENQRLLMRILFDSASAVWHLISIKDQEYKKTTHERRESSTDIYMREKYVSDYSRALRITPDLNKEL